VRVKRYLIILLLVSAVVYGVYLVRVNEHVSSVYARMSDPKFWVFAAFGFSLVFIGHIIRSYKFKRLLDPVKDSGIRTQFQSLLIGYLFNTLLPLRLGEIVRAVVLGRSLKISASFMFALIMLERATDALLLVLIGAVLLALGLIPHTVIATILWIGLLLVTLAALLLAVLLALYTQHLVLLKFWHHTTAMFNERIKNSLRFKIWTVIYGLQKIVNRRALAAYFGRSLLMWFCYLGGLAIFAVYFFPHHLAANLLRSWISFLGVSVPSGPAYLGSFQALTDPLFRALDPAQASLNWLVASWLLLAIPSSLIGAVLLLRHRTDYSRIIATRNKASLQNKLAREEDASQELASFLDAFFSRNTVSHILHQLETKEDIKLIQLFKGGSDASTILVHQNGHYTVKKVIPAQYAHRLKAQCDWLRKFSNLERVVKLTHEHETDTYYSIDIEYYPDYTPFFDYIHSQSLARSEKILRGVFEFLFENVYQLEVKTTNEEALEAYVKSKLWGKLDQATKLNHELSLLRDYDTLIINGVEYQNIHHVMEQIRANKHAWRDIATYRASQVHGDVTVDNILTSAEHHDFKIIDPAPDGNEIAGPVFDFGRQYQSLGYGYEFLCRDDTRIEPKGNEIRYEDSSSAYYRDLREYFRGMAKEMLEPEEYRAMLFHTAILYSRVLAHRVHINPANVAKFYAVSVRAFNDFLDQYK
jgi:hypothetical protein